MYKEPVIIPKRTNEKIARMVEQKLEETAEKLLDGTATDSSFMKNLYDLCILNRMRESHEKGEKR